MENFHTENLRTVRNVSLCRASNIIICSKPRKCAFSVSHSRMSFSFSYNGKLQGLFIISHISISASWRFVYELTDKDGKRLSVDEINTIDEICERDILPFTPTESEN